MAGLVTDAGDGDVPERLPARDHRAARDRGRARAARQQAGVRHGDHRRARRRSTWPPAISSSTRRPIRSCRSPRTRRSCRCPSCTGSARRRARSPTATTSGGSSRVRSSGAVGAFKRTYNRRDFSLVPPAPTLLDHIRDAGQSVVGIGKISDIFAGRGLTFSMHSEGNRDGLHLTLEALATLDRGLLFVNLVDFDMVYGHRNDVGRLRARAGRARSLAARAGGRAAPRGRRVHHRRPRQRSDDARHRPHARAGAAARVRPRRPPRPPGHARVVLPISDRRSPRGWASRALPNGESFLAALHAPA